MIEPMSSPRILHLAHALSQGKISSVGLVSDALDRAMDSRGEGGRAFTRLYRERALADAAFSDARISAGRQRSTLEGLPLSVKDLCDVAGEPTTAGSKALLDSPPAAADAVIVKHLRDAGAVIVGKTNMTEFAFSGLGLNPHFGDPRSPWRREENRIAGGSSSGAAVSVTDRMAVAAIGSDTGGSIRTPAAFCGIVGFKPSAQRISRQGCFELSATLDSLGPLANSVSCCALVDAILSRRLQSSEAAYRRPTRSPRFAIAGGYALDDCDPVVARQFDAALRRLGDAGATLVPLSGNPFSLAGELVRTGSFATLEGWGRHHEMLTRIQDRMDGRVARRFLSGDGDTERRLEEMRAIRSRLIRAATEAMVEFDAVLMPTVPILPPRIEELKSYSEYVRLNGLTLRNTAIANFIDGCALTLPCSNPSEPPVGLTLMGLNGMDSALFQNGLWVEGALAA